MCKAPKAPPPPQVVIRDPVKEAADAANAAAGLSNASLAKRRKLFAQNSLFTNGATGYTGQAGNSLLAKAQAS